MARVWRLWLCIVDPATPFQLCAFAVLCSDRDPDRALRRPPEIVAIREVGLPGERHLFSEASRRQARVDTKILSQVALGMIGADSRDVVGTLDAGEEWPADTRLERSSTQGLGLIGYGDFVETGRLRLGARPVVREIANRPVLKMSELITRE